MYGGYESRHIFNIVYIVYGKRVSWAYIHWYFRVFIISFEYDFVRFYINMPTHIRNIKNKCPFSEFLVWVPLCVIVKFLDMNIVFRDVMSIMRSISCMIVGYAGYGRKNYRYGVGVYGKCIKYLQFLSQKNKHFLTCKQNIYVNMSEAIKFYFIFGLYLKKWFSFSWTLYYWLIPSLSLRTNISLLQDTIPHGLFEWNLNEKANALLISFIFVRNKHSII